LRSIQTNAMAPEAPQRKQMSDRKKKTTLVVGLGEVGQPLWHVLKRDDPDTLGIDIEPVFIDASIGIMHICFPFSDRAQFHAAVIHYAQKYTPEVIVINSTVIPGTTRDIELAAGIPCVYSPVRGKHTKMVDELYTYVKFVAGTDAQAAERVSEHFTSAGLKSETMSAPEALELAKLLETTYFGLLIAWAQEMNRFAGSVNADYLEIGRFFREIAYLPGMLFQPGYIGGHCVMPNIELLQQSFKSAFLDAIKTSNEARKLELEKQPHHSTDKRLQPLVLK
jgi:UDP-N-acetyl-D-mannosaminuronate dehydrogenase